MDIRTQSALLASIVGIALGVSMLLRGERPKVVTLYAFFALTSGGFYLALFFNQLFVNAAWLPSWAKQVTASSTLILGALVPSAALAFFLEWLGVSPRSNRKGRWVALLSAVFGLAVGLSPLSQKDWAKVALAVWVFAALGISVSLLVRRMRQSTSRIERARLMYLASGAGLSLLFAGLDFLLFGFDVDVPTLGPVVATLYLFFLRETLLRLRLMDLQELLSKLASQTVLAGILAAVITPLTLWAAGAGRASLTFNALVSAIVVLILVDPLRSKVEERVLALFFRERFQLLRSLGALRARMANVIDVSEMTTMVLDTLIETRRVTHASVYLLAEDRPGYRLIDHRGPQPVTFLDAAAARGLLHAAASGQKAVLLENLERKMTEMRAQTESRRQRDELKRLADTRAALGQLKSGVCVPLVGNDRVIGFFNIWDERMPEAFASDEIALILEVTERIAIGVENSKLYEKMRERDRLAALGEMAAGLAHEIRNPLGAIKGAAQFLEPKRLPGEGGEFLEVIVEEVNRLNGVVSAFLDYSRPLKQSFGPTDINEVVTRTIRLIQNDIPQHLQLKVELGDGLNKVDGDAEQLKQVLINLVQNAIQAMGPQPGSLTVRTLKPERFGDFRPEMIEVQVTDTGPGIAPEQQRHIFVPFFTTKEKGTGLGLAICQRIVKNHGGTISVQSRPGEGCTFVVRMPALPAAEVAQPPELTLLSSTPPSAAASNEESSGVHEAPVKKPSRRDKRRRQPGA
ncbi:MAG TPA: ATP-binding protein [Myxococcaceae bacterium]|nr:ATP-binding protein [Myxococcaceae bacterium]